MINPINYLRVKVNVLFETLKVYAMKSNRMILPALLALACSGAVLAQEQATMDVMTDTPVTELETTAPADGGISTSVQQKGMMYKGCKHRKGQGGMKRGGGRQGMGRHDKHDEVVRRLDMIEARMAKIEAMLESLMRR